MKRLKMSDFPNGFPPGTTVRMASPLPEQPMLTDRQKTSVAITTSLEDELYGQIIAAGLPQPIRQAEGVIKGRKFVYDFCWAVSFEKLVLVEVQGAIHSTVGFGAKRRQRPSGHNTAAGISRDAEKCNLAQLAGHVVLLVTGEAIRSGQALMWIERALERK